jgi:hypothetical protein
MRIAILILLITLSACGQLTKSFPTKKEIKIDSVDFIYIKKNQIDNDSLRFNLDQTKMFVNNWNDSKSIGLSKYFPQFWIVAKMTNGSIRTFRTNNNNIKENNDWTFSIGDSSFISSLWENNKNPFLKPDQFNPITFLNAVSRNSRSKTGSFIIPITMFDNFPIDWVKKEHIDTLISVLNSKDTCGCILNPLSSFIPNDYADKGGYAAIFIKAFRDKKPVSFGLHSCPKVDEQLNEELINWWSKEKIK